MTTELFQWLVAAMILGTAALDTAADFLNLKHAALELPREFEGIYDVTVMAVTQDRAQEALAAQLSMQGVAYNNALALGKRFLEAIQWAQ